MNIRHPACQSGGFKDLRVFLEQKVDEFNRPEFIPADPIQVPHLYSLKEDIEIAGFITATLAWGQRKAIISKSMELMRLMENRPFAFVMEAGENDFRRFDHFCYRTFNSTDTLYFLNALRNLYANHGGLRGVFEEGFRQKHDAGHAIMYFRNRFFELDFPARTTKHVADISKGSAAKRINLFLRWMVRKDDRGVDFGLWDSISPTWLHIPLDVHSGNTARVLGILGRKQNDHKAVMELTQQLRQFDPYDPVKYDYALFGLSAFTTSIPSGYIIRDYVGTIF